MKVKVVYLAKQGTSHNHNLPTILTLTSDITRWCYNAQNADNLTSAHTLTLQTAILTSPHPPKGTSYPYKSNIHCICFHVK